MIVRGGQRMKHRFRVPFLRDDRGVSAVEFALLCPVLMVLFCASIDLGSAITASNRATFVADVIAELVSQVDHPLKADEVTAFMTTALLIDPDILTYQRRSGISADQAVNITISSVAFSQTVPSCTASCDYKAEVVFSKRNNTLGPARSCGTLTAVADTADPSPSTLPRSLYGPVPLVVIDVEVFVKPVFTFLITGDMKFARSSYFRPRNVDRVNSKFNCNGFTGTS